MSWERRVPKIKVGDRVRLAASFLQSTGQVAGEAAHLRGEVLAILSPDQPYARAVIKRDGEEQPGRVVLSNLSRIGQGGVSER